MCWQTTLTCGTWVFTNQNKLVQWDAIIAVFYCVANDFILNNRWYMLDIIFSATLAFHCIILLYRGQPLSYWAIQLCSCFHSLFRPTRIQIKPQLLSIWKTPAVKPNLITSLNDFPSLPTECPYHTLVRKWQMETMHLVIFLWEYNCLEDKGDLAG